MDKEPKPRITGKQWASIALVAIALVAIALVFILQNLTYVRVEFFLFHTAAPLWLILLITLAAGYAIGRFSKRRN
ncbi:hypothetical protein [Glutamicibacter nicotianae]|uniref:hypothetical protein n=1 Tax=Glutamicibacter nicotianae TaxID=37929 RepID=UPI002555F608|nr:hypothetical protein [Glutamicibacter nicotianae]WIV43424.1 hypothetical protein QQS42_14065 [Glutamicibacter nicotianae]